MTKLKQPVGQARHTNVAVVRYRSGGKNFEVACYRNKALSWRAGNEQDLGEVLQTTEIFTNVGKGEFASREELQRVFGTKDKEEVCMRILKEGHFQISDRERESHMEALFHDISTIVAERCVNPMSGTPFSVSMIETALKEEGFSVKPTEPPKKQALKALEFLCKRQPEQYARAHMVLRITAMARQKEAVMNFVVEIKEGPPHSEETHEADDHGPGIYSIAFACMPSCYRACDTFVSETLQPPGTLQIVSAAHPMQTILKPAEPTPAPPRRVVEPESAERREGGTCKQCDLGFDSHEEHRAHCKTEWHGFNVKRFVKSLPPVSQAEFDDIREDIRDAFFRRRFVVCLCPKHGPGGGPHRSGRKRQLYM
eukprot:Polyplicarium_translucidae@DN2437_c0_g1_i1.p1